MTFASEAWPFVLPPALFAVLLAALRLWLPAAVLALVALLVLGFFRVPRRPVGGDAEVLLSPADGRGMAVDRLAVPELGEGQFQRVATFLSVFNVHVQRSPTAGEVVVSSYRPGQTQNRYRLFLPNTPQSRYR